MAPISSALPHDDRPGGSGHLRKPPPLTAIPTQLSICVNVVGLAEPRGIVDPGIGVRDGAAQIATSMINDHLR